RRGPDRMYFLGPDGVSRPLLVLNVLLAFVYLALIGLWFPRGNPYIFAILIIGELYHIWQIISFIHTIWSPTAEVAFDDKLSLPVDVYITVCGEPVDIVSETVIACKSMDYDDLRIFILNDGF